MKSSIAEPSVAIDLCDLPRQSSSHRPISVRDRERDRNGAISAQDSPSRLSELLAELGTLDSPEATILAEVCSDEKGFQIRADATSGRPQEVTSSHYLIDRMRADRCESSSNTSSGEVERETGRRQNARANKGTFISWRSH